MLTDIQDNCVLKLYIRITLLDFACILLLFVVAMRLIYSRKARS